MNLYQSNWQQDLERLGRPLKSIIILDNAPASYLFHPDNAIPITSWFSDLNDDELENVREVLEGLVLVDDVTKVLDHRKAKS